MRLVDADALLKHEVESDRLKGVFLVVSKGHILNAPTVASKEREILSMLLDIANTGRCVELSNRKGNNSLSIRIDNHYWYAGWIGSTFDDMVGDLYRILAAYIK